MHALSPVLLRYPSNVSAVSNRTGAHNSTRRRALSATILVIEVRHGKNSVGSISENTIVVREINVDCPRGNNCTPSEDSNGNTGQESVLVVCFFSLYARASV